MMSKLEVDLDSDGIMRVNQPNHAVITVHHIRKEYEKRKDIKNTRTPLLVTIHGAATLSEEAQEVLCGAEFCAITESEYLSIREWQNCRALGRVG
jgi:hypothetical protein